METNTELLNRIEAHIKGRLAVAESRAASSELYEGKKIAYNSILGFVRSLRADLAATTAENTEETHSLQEWAKIMAERPDLRAEFDKMCPPQPVQGSIAPEADLDELIKQEMVKVYETYTRPDYIEENTTEAAYDFDAHIARHFYNLNPKHK